MMNKRNDRTEKSEWLNGEVWPACRFGPGGDFVSLWPIKSSTCSRTTGNRLSRLLDLLAELMHTVLGVDFEDSSIEPAIVQNSVIVECHDDREKSIDDAEKQQIQRSGYAKTTSIASINSTIPNQSQLFTDDWRVSMRTGHKPKHRIRTHQRTSKKRTSFSDSGQGSLFEVDFKSARTA